MLFSVKVKAALVGLVVAGGATAALALGPAGWPWGSPHHLPWDSPHSRFSCRSR